LDIRFTARTGDVTSSMKEKATEKLSRLSRYYDRITWVDVVLDTEHGKKTVEVSAGLNRGATIVGKAGGADMYEAIDLAIDKLSRQLLKHKEKLNDHRPRRPESGAGSSPGEAPEPTFEEAIRDLEAD
jgi:putative sigma-54 modulation protein